MLQAFAVPIAHGGFCSSYSCTLAQGADKTTPDNEVDHHQPTHKYKYKERNTIFIDQGANTAVDRHQL